MRITRASFRTMTAAACAAGFACSDPGRNPTKEGVVAPSVVTSDFVGHMSRSDGIRIVPADRASELGVAAVGLIRALPVVKDGRPGINPADTIEVRDAGAVAVDDPAACEGFAVSYCAPLAVQSFFDRPIRNAAIQIRMLAPSTGRAALNSDVFTPEYEARFGPTPGASLGFWRYAGAGLLTPGESAVRTVVFDNTASGDFVFLGRFVGDLFDATCPDSELGSGVGDAVFTGATTAASDDFEPTCAASDGAPDLSLSWTAPSAGTFEVDTVGSDFDTVLTVLNGGCGGSEVVCDDDGAGSLRSRARIATTAGQTFALLVDGFGAASGNVVVNIRDITTCGDGTVDAGEACDDGNTTNGDGCSDSCRIEPGCGNGVVEPPETCDDGNTTAGDGCDELCQIEPVCGNGTIEAGESCDDGNTTDGDGCSAACQLEGACPTGDLASALGAPVAGGNTSAMANLFAPTCATAGAAGDGSYLWTAPRDGTFVFDTAGSDFDTVLSVLDGNCGGAALACDDDSGPGTQSQLSVALSSGAQVTVVVDGFGSAQGNYSLNIREVVCGDTIVDSPEECDDGNTADGDGCSSTCSLELLCGNGVVQAPEECDDGNITPGDGCSATCIVEELGTYTFPPGGPAVFGDSINPETQVDSFRVVIAAAALFSAETFEDAVAGTCDVADTVIRIRDALGNEITNNDEGGVNSCSKITAQRLDPGLYFVSVESWSGAPAVIPHYDLVLDSVAADVCGNSVTETGEQCDDGNTADGDGCSSTCQFEQTCGNGAIEGTETCDDGNTTSGDGCSDTCQVELVCPDVDLGSAVGPSVASGSNGGHVSQFNPSAGCSTPNDGADVVFQWTAPAAGSYTIDSVGSDYDTVVYVLDAVCGGTELVCDDDGGPGLQSTVTVSLGASQTVSIVMDAFGSAIGNYVLNIAQN
ncbi:MAG: DUF4215 domain-containing protein [Deltaproteobacteria bacterium]|nr:DUF4215 domain-containing protein [Deltaproteobacteria bacterium]